MKDYLKDSILRTLAFFAAQDKVVTLTELHTSLIRSRPDQGAVSFSELRNAAGEMVEAGDIHLRRGLYALPEAEHVWGTRLARYNQSMRLFKKARRFAGALRFIPYVRAAALSGSVAQGNASATSDIDLFIIVQPKRMFLARFLVSAFFQVLGMRRHDTKINERFCLNHYIVADLAMRQDKNEYTAMLYTSFLSLFGRDYFRRFLDSNLDWINKFLLHPSLPYSHFFPAADIPQSGWQRAFEFLLSPVAPFLESTTRYFQKRRIHQSEYVIVSESELSFHPDSKGQRILSRYQNILHHFMLE